MNVNRAGHCKTLNIFTNGLFSHIFLQGLYLVISYIRACSGVRCILLGFGLNTIFAKSCSKFDVVSSCTSCRYRDVCQQVWDFGCRDAGRTLATSRRHSLYYISPLPVISCGRPQNAKGSSLYVRVNDRIPSDWLVNQLPASGDHFCGTSESVRFSKYSKSLAVDSGLSWSPPNRCLGQHHNLCRGNHGHVACTHVLLWYTRIVDLKASEQVRRFKENPMTHTNNSLQSSGYKQRGVALHVGAKHSLLPHIAVNPESRRGGSEARGTGILVRETDVFSEQPRVRL